MKHMKKTLTLTSLFTYWVAQVSAASSNVLGISDGDLRNWNIDINDIPVAIQSLINFFLSIAGTITVIFVIVWAYKILFGSLQQDKTKWKNTIMMALWGFAVASLAWVIIKVILANLA